MLRMRRLSTACGLKRQAPTYVMAKRHLHASLSCHAASVTLSRLLLGHCNRVKLSLEVFAKVCKRNTMTLISMDDPSAIFSACY